MYYTYYIILCIILCIISLRHNTGALPTSERKTWPAGQVAGRLVIMEPDAAAALVDKAIAQTVTLTAAAEVQRLDARHAHEKALGILASLKEQAHGLIDI